MALQVNNVTNILPDHHVRPPRLTDEIDAGRAIAPINPWVSGECLDSRGFLYFKLSQVHMANQIFE